MQIPTYGQDHRPSDTHACSNTQDTVIDSQNTSTAFTHYPHCYSQTYRPHTASLGKLGIVQAIFNSCPHGLPAHSLQLQIQRLPKRFGYCLRYCIRRKDASSARSGAAEGGLHIMPAYWQMLWCRGIWENLIPSIPRRVHMQACHAFCSR